MSLYLPKHLSQRSPSYPCFGLYAFNMKIGYSATPQNATISPSIEKVSYGSFFTKDINGYMIPADSKTNINNLYYGTCIVNQEPFTSLDPKSQFISYCNFNFTNKNDYENLNNGFLNTNTAQSNFRFYTLNDLPYLQSINAIANGNSFSTGDTVAIGENGRIDKFIDPDTQTKLPLKVCYTEQRYNVSDKSVTVLNLR